MKKRKSLMMSILMVTLLLLPAVSFAAFDSGSTGVDGELSPPTSPSTYTVPAKSDGVYNYTTITIPTGVTVTFPRNTNNTPITIKATGDVTIAGTLSVNGSNASGGTPGAGGPGGFDGGVGGYPNANGFRGQGPGGGVGGTGTAVGGGGGFGVTGGDGANGSGGPAYGNPGLIPLIGGSGGGGGYGASRGGGSGGGGGGAIVIASSGAIRVDGTLTANGGSASFVTQGISNSYPGGSGSGGAIRLVANTITGNGSISATGVAAVIGGASNGSNYLGGKGGDGRIKLEANSINLNPANITPQYSGSTLPSQLYPTANPKLYISKINGNNVTQPPIGAFRNPDMTLPYNSTGPVTVTVAGENIPVGKSVTLKALPESGNTVVTISGTLAGTTASSSVDLTLNNLSSSVSYVFSAAVDL